MENSFRFYTEAGLVSHTNFKAESLKSLLHGLKKVSGSSIFYHLHHALLRRHFAGSDHMNDFARWVLVQLGQNSLAERLTAVDPMGCRSVREAREQLIAKVEEYVGVGELFFRVAEGNEFHFLELHSTVIPLNIVADDLESFYTGLKKASLGTFFYHLIEAPIRLGKTSNDFSEWLGNTIFEGDLATEIAQLNPYMYNLYELKAEITSLVRKRLKEISKP
jgi:hypothetical protein